MILLNFPFNLSLHIAFGFNLIHLKIDANSIHKKMPRKNNLCVIITTVSRALGRLHF